MTIRHTIAHVALALLLMLSQQLAVAHAVTHLGPDSTTEKKTSFVLDCDQCVAFASIASIVTGPSASWFTKPAVYRTAVDSDDFVLLPVAARVFDPRAPPFAT